ncbi:MAG: hypothetical protein ACJ79K_02570 [Gemmatimonadaceae bacterium]
MPTAAPDTLRVVLVIDDTSARRSLVRGTTLGAEEAARTGAMFGTPVALRIVVRAGFESMSRAALSHASRVTRPSLYIVAGDSLLCSEVALQGGRDSTPVLDAGCPPASGAAGADRATVYTIDSRATVPAPAGAPASAAPDSSHLELWVASLEKFGGEQLNQRFRRRFGAPMDSDAWAGWFAMKIALDLALHAHASSGGALLARLADPATSFDGQKGRPLRFSATAHRLVQPLYRVTGSGADAHVVEEVVR